MRSHSPASWRSQRSMWSRWASSVEASAVSRSSTTLPTARAIDVRCCRWASRTGRNRSPPGSRSRPGAGGVDRLEPCAHHRRRLGGQREHDIGPAEGGVEFVGPRYPVKSTLDAAVARTSAGARDGSPVIHQSQSGRIRAFQHLGDRLVGCEDAHEDHHRSTEPSAVAAEPPVVDATPASAPVARWTTCTTRAPKHPRHEDHVDPGRTIATRKRVGPLDQEWGPATGSAVRPCGPGHRYRRDDCRAGSRLRRSRS